VDAKAKLLNHLFPVSVVKVNRNNSRAMLKLQMQEQARQQSAQWLARELGYKDVQEHLWKLKVNELQRKTMVRRLKDLNEQERQKRDLLREQAGEGEGEGELEMQQPVKAEEDDDSDSDYDGGDEEDDADEDEEVRLTKCKRDRSPVAHECLWCHRRR
jgi:hypothetical protein